ncbi:accessory Sec system protein Asp1 [Schleiferilactobacillus shenzhenensis]|uniref:accessory Sec system protein Asp1 n=1 Tax=Schleiferilactobacillus shenzhenensis TaxID=1231337 RepID=UPI0003FF8D51|nr:accessory Sec system protein Asp1 [Schleiferilactobacillus shenzhenensis]
MDYLLPAWPSGIDRFERDPIVNLAQLFNTRGHSAMLLLLQEAPWLRYQLHTNGLAGMPWWSAFDALQDVAATDGLPWSFADLTWPDAPRGVIQYPLYGPHGVTMMRDDRPWAAVQFAMGGFVAAVQWFAADGYCLQKDTYDDRGFLTTSTWYTSAGTETKKEWFTPMGTVAVTAAAGAVTVNAEWAAKLGRPTFTDLDHLVLAVAAWYLTAQPGGHLVVPADHPLLSQAAPLTQHHPLVVLQSTEMRQADFIEPSDHFAHTVVVPTQRTAAVIRQSAKPKAAVRVPAVQVIPPFAAELRLGESTELSTVTLYWRVGAQPAPDRLAVIAPILVNILAAAPERQIVIDCASDRDAQTVVLAWLTALARTIGVAPDSAEFQALQALPPGTDSVSEPAALTDTHRDSAQSILKRCRIAVAPALAEIEADLQKTRLVVDLADTPDLFVQIAAISAGLPQINRAVTGFVQDHQNGLVITADDQLADALDYYLATFTHWDEAVVACVDRLDGYAADQLLKTWEEVLRDD